MCANEYVNNVRVVVTLMLHGPCNIHGSNTKNGLAVSGVFQCKFHVREISLPSRGVSGTRDSCWAIKLLVSCLNNNAYRQGGDSTHSFDPFDLIENAVQSRYINFKWLAFHFLTWNKTLRDLIVHSLNHTLQCTITLQLERALHDMRFAIVKSN